MAPILANPHLNTMKIKYSILDFTPKDINEENHSLRAVFSTGDVDRHGEIVDQKSWILDDFMQNPVVLFGHDHSQPPVGKIIGLSYNADGNLEGEVQFAAKEYPFANVIWNLYKGGFMKAFSVGFSAGNVDIINEQVVLRNNTLFEISTVSVPANAMALAKSKGLDVAPLEEKLLEVAVQHQEDCQTKALSLNDCPTCKKTVELSTEVAKIEVAASPSKPAEEEKGAVADKVDEIDVWEQKWELMSDVSDITCALWQVFMDENTPVDAFEELVTEAASLMTGVAQAASGTETAVASPSPSPSVYAAALKAALEEVKNSDLSKTILGTLKENKKPAQKQEVVLAKGIEALITSIKEGRVLSKKNRSTIEDALKALQAVLDADKKEEPKEDKTIVKDISVDTTVLRAIKVETPTVRVTIPAKGRGKAKNINKAIRRLLAEKAKTKS